MTTTFLDAWLIALVLGVLSLRYFDQAFKATGPFKSLSFIGALAWGYLFVRFMIEQYF